MQLPSSWKSGKYTVEVSTDTNDDVYESTQIGNNIIKKNLGIEHVLPDLTIDSYNMTVTGSEESGNIKIQMIASIKNIGEKDINSETWYNVIVFNFP